MTTRPAAPTPKKLSERLEAVRRTLGASGKISTESPENYELVSILNGIARLEGLRERAEAIRGAVERESYWCEDCQKEIPKKYHPDESGFHEDHEVVPITVIAGWRQAELAEISGFTNSKPTTEPR